MKKTGGKKWAVRRHKKEIKVENTEPKLYPGSEVEVRGRFAGFYDLILNSISFGTYAFFMKDAIKNMKIQKGDSIFDFGAGAGKNSCIMRSYAGDAGIITGFEIGREMAGHFKKRCKNFINVELLDKRIDGELNHENMFTKGLISFVLHGLPRESRIKTIKNAFKLLKSGGTFYILDYAEGDCKKWPFYLRLAFEKFECPYAFEYIKNDWKSILKGEGFTVFSEKFYYQRTVRLLGAGKP